MGRLFFISSLFLLAVLCTMRGDGATSGAASETPGTADFLRGSQLFREGEIEDAYLAFAAAGKANPALAPAGVLTALFFFQEGNLAQTHEFLNRAIAESPNDPEAWYRLARLAADDQRYPELELLLMRGDESLNAFAESNGNADRLLFLKGESVALSARLAQGKGNLSSAESKMREFTALYPDNGDGYLSLGYLLLQQDKTDEAIAEFSRAKERNPNLLSGWLTAASLLNGRGDTETAFRLLDEHKNDIGLSPADFSRMASLFFKRGKLDEVVRIKEHLPVGSLDRFKWDGLLASSGGDYVTAEKAYQDALKAAPDDFESINGLILAIADQGKEERQQDVLNRADRFRRRYPQSDEAAGTYAWVEFRCGNTERAEDVLLPILDRGGLTPTSAYYLACIVLCRKDNALAEQLLDSALASPDFFPKRADAEKLRESLERPAE